ncbi:MAG: chondroitinase family protein [Chitinophagaceae bacterium]
MYKQFTFLLLFSYTCLTTFCQAPEDICESKTPSNWSAINGSLSISERHFKQGGQSIRWDWVMNNAALKITDTAFLKAALDKRSCFAVWIYNEAPVRDSLIFSFGNSNKKDCSFTFQLNFKGWRTAWVMYNRDMKGKPSATTGSLTIYAPVSVKTGALFFDAMQSVTTVDPRAPMRDMQLPFINPVNGNKTANAHWVNLLQFSQLPDYIKLPKTISTKEIADMETIKNRYEEIIMTAKAAQKDQTQSTTAFDTYNIKRSGDIITGKPVNSINAYEINHTVSLAKAKEYAQKYGAQNASDLLFKIATAYRSTAISPEEKGMCSKQFLYFLDHLHDQGGRTEVAWVQYIT